MQPMILLSRGMKKEERRFYPRNFGFDSEWLKDIQKSFWKGRRLNTSTKPRGNKFSAGDVIRAFPNREWLSWEKSAKRELCI
jgi:hypothetical protein